MVRMPFAGLLHRELHQYIVSSLFSPDHAAIRPDCERWNDEQLRQQVLSTSQDWGYSVIMLCCLVVRAGARE